MVREQLNGDNMLQQDQDDEMERAIQQLIVATDALWEVGKDKIYLELDTAIEKVVNLRSKKQNKG